MSNSYYNHSTYPTPNAPGSSANMRAELDLITAGFAKLPTLSGNGYKVAMVNAAGTALIASSALQALAITASTIDNTVIGATTRAAGSFTTLSANSTVNLGTSVTIGGGTINNSIIGGTTPAAGYFTTVEASSMTVSTLAATTFTGNLVGNVTGNVTGDLAGNVTTSSGTSTFNNVTINGTLDMSSGTVGTITGLATPTNSSDATPKSYVDTQVATRLALAGGTMSGAIAMGTNRITGMGDPSSAQDAATKAYTDTQRDTRLALAGGTMSGAIAMGTNKITGLGTPTADADAATKAYVDGVAQGLDVKASVRAATTANITLSGTATIDGVSVIAGDRVLVKDQTTQSENGIWVVAAGGWGRASDMDAWTEFPGAFVFVESGSTNDNSGWVCTVAPGGTVGSTAVTFEQFSGAGQITAGNGMSKSGNTLNVGTASSARIVVNTDNIDLATTGVSTGTYKSVTVDAYGRVTAGTNPTTLAGYGITDAYTQTQVDTALALKLNLSGGTMSGNIAMDGNRVTGLGAPSGGNDATTKTYVDTQDALKLSLSGGTMSGAIAMGTNKITGLGDPTSSQDAVTLSYVTTLYGSTASAAASAAAAAISETNAANSATSASGSASAAASSASAAAASYDSFDDRYLGSKTSDPTVDNDGNALLTGALYWNSSLALMKAYDGAAWQIAYVPSSFYLPLTGGTLTGGLTGTTLTMSGAASIEGITVGRGAGAVSTNTAVGASALAANTSGTHNNAFGNSALALNTTGGASAAMGWLALYANTTGGEHVAVGHAALGSNTTGTRNVAIGHTALNQNTTASNNTAVGYQAGYSNTGGENTFVGGVAGYSNTGNYNSAFGRASLYANTSGANNTAIGHSALTSNTTASNNTAVGYQAGYSGTTAHDNVLVGDRSGYGLTSGYCNTFVGAGVPGNSFPSGYSNTTGYYNTYVGAGAGESATTGIFNSFFGTLSGRAITTGSKNTILGTFSGNQGGLDIRTADNYIVLSDGDGNPRVIVDGSGNTGFSAVPSTWFSGGQVQGPSFGISSIAGVDQTAWTTGVYQPVYTGTWKHRGAYNGSMYQQTGNSHVFYSDNSGSTGAGTDVTWAATLAVTINNSVALQGATPQSGIGITFPATQNASSNANTLDDYEEGTWSPGVTGAGSGTLSYSWGRYTKVGNIVHIEGKVGISGGTGTDNLSITGLPFSGADNSDSAARPCAFPEGDWTGINTAMDLNGMFRLDTAKLDGVKDNGTGASVYLYQSDLSSNWDFNFSVTYRTAT